MRFHYYGRFGQYFSYSAPPFDALFFIFLVPSWPFSVLECETRDTRFFFFLQNQFSVSTSQPLTNIFILSSKAFFLAPAISTNPPHCEHRSLHAIF